MLKIYCDRCGKEVKQRNSYDEMENKIELLGNKYELCECCYSEVMDFIFKYKNKKEVKK